jgi:hypothetical protein
LIAAKVSALDEVVGRVVAGLIKSGLYENTIIVFTSDVRIGDRCYDFLNIFAEKIGVFLLKTQLNYAKL